MSTSTKWLLGLGAVAGIGGLIYWFATRPDPEGDAARLVAAQNQLMADSAARQRELQAQLPGHNCPPGMVC